MRRMALGTVYRRRKEGGQPKEHLQFCYDLLWDGTELKEGSAVGILQQISSHGDGSLDDVIGAFRSDDLLTACALGLHPGQQDWERVRANLTFNGLAAGDDGQLVQHTSTR